MAEPYYAPNRDAFICPNVALPVAGAPVQMPYIEIPDGMSLVVKSHPANGGLIYIGATRPQSQNVVTAWPLVANEAIAYRVKNANSVWVTPQFANEIVCMTVEQ